ncbi:unnamed protein product [Rotaria sordida]|uniref:Pentatricopeptide repeat-containing protein n=1 Tax=Rotaria sordida TaxID=392033 RepID=A0A815PM21_9BILA|nr:unnamed protein product [Rotaria sordida]
MANKAIDLYNEIINPNEVIIILLFNACAQLATNETLNLIKKVFKEIPKDYHSNTGLLTSLLDALMKSGDVVYAESLLEKSANKSISMYGAMMKGYIRNNQANKAIDVFNKIKNPDEINVNLLFNACAQLDVWMKCGDVTNAELLYNKSTKKTLSMYEAMMKGYIDNNMINKSIDLFHEIKDPDEVIIILLFNACAQLATNEILNLIKKVFKQIPKDYHSNTRLLTSLLDALIKCGDFSSAQIIFSNMEKSVITYSIMMNGYIKENNPKQVLDLFNQMKIDGIEADLIIYLYIIKALSDIGDYSLSLSFIKQIPHSIAVDNRIHNALIDMWGKTGDFDEAKKIFEKIFQPNQIEYTSMINSYGLNGMGIQALELFHQMPSEFIDERTYICILNACSHSGLVDEARSIFDKIQIDCLSRAAFFEEAQKLIDEFECHHSPVRSLYN